MSKPQTLLVDALAKTYPVESDYREMVNLARDLEIKVDTLYTLLSTVQADQFKSLIQKEELFEEMLDSRT